MISITISTIGKPPSGGFPITIELPENTTIGAVKNVISAKIPKLYVARQKLTLKGEKKPLADDVTLEGAGVSDSGELLLKDLGPQISWRTVFFIEYVGPLIIHPLIYHFPKVFYGGSVQHSSLQKYVYGLVLLHFAKRELEAVFVHRFSHGTMPAFNIIKNSAHYWILSGVGLAYAVYSPTYSIYSPYIKNTIRSNPRFLLACTALWAFAELSNFAAHLTLRSLRPAGTRTRAIPYGYGFNLVSCPNYFFEILAWTAIAVMTGSWAAWVFVVASAYIMTLWAIKKHKAYKKEFGADYPRGRKVIFPFIF